MPTYEYKCVHCNGKFEFFQSMTDEPLKQCPVCNTDTLKRLLGTGAGIIFKGSGFYQTDYRSESYKRAAKNDNSQPGTPAKATNSKPGNT